MAQREPP